MAESTFEVAGTELNASMAYGGKVTITFTDRGNGDAIGTVSDPNAKAGDVIIANPQPDTSVVRVFIKCICATDGTITFLNTTFENTAWAGQRTISYIGIHP